MKWILPTLSLLLSTGSFAGVLKVMQYNAENFFDTVHDEGTNDYTYLPVKVKRSMPEQAEYCNSMTSRFYRDQCLNLDWNEEKFNKKVQNLSRVIKSYDKSGTGPDIIVLQEVENINVLYKLISGGLGRMGYHHPVLIEGDDSRGIDVGIISRFPVISSRHHSVLHNGEILDTRGILEVVLDVNDKKVVVFANHWPSQNNPVDERIASAKLLARISEKRSEDLIIAVGDFNTTASDNPSPYRHLKNFIDPEVEARKLNPNLNPGTHYFRGEWTSLDKIFIHKSSSFTADYSSFEIMIRDFYMQTDASGVQIPVRSSAETGDGFSDHLPVKLHFNY